MPGNIFHAAAPLKCLRQVTRLATTCEKTITTATAYLSTTYNKTFSTKSRNSNATVQDASSAKKGLASFESRLLRKFDVSTCQRIEIQLLANIRHRSLTG